MLAAFDVTLLTIFVLCSTQLLRPKGETRGSIQEVSFRKRISTSGRGVSQACEDFVSNPVP